MTGVLPEVKLPGRGILNIALEGAVKITIVPDPKGI